MATQVKTLDAVYFRNEKNEILRIDDVNSPTPLRTKTSPCQHLDSEFWVGYCSSDQHFIDKIELPGNAEMKLRGLRDWWESLIPGWMRLIYCFVFCLRPSIFIGTLPFVSFILHEEKSPLIFVGYPGGYCKTELSTQDTIHLSGKEPVLDAGILRPIFPGRRCKLLRPEAIVLCCVDLFKSAGKSKHPLCCLGDRQTPPSIPILGRSKHLYDHCCSDQCQSSEYGDRSSSWRESVRDCCGCVLLCSLEV